MIDKCEKQSKDKIICVKWLLLFQAYAKIDIVLKNLFDLGENSYEFNGSRCRRYRMGMGND